MDDGFGTKERELAVTVVVYHYVRDVEKTPFREIKACSVEEFERQLEYFRTRYTLVSWPQVRAAIQGTALLPERACLLTFDDGLTDHYQTVFPRLRRAGVPGLFSLIARPETDRLSLVHLLQFLIARLGADEFRQHFLGALPPDLRVGYDRSEATILSEREPDRFDAAPLVALKTVIQKRMPDQSLPILQALFAEKLGDEAAFARELYLTPEQAQEMLAGGMALAGHGAGHYWMRSLSPEQKQDEVARSARWLDSLGLPSPWAFSYPYGDYDETLFPLLSENRFAAAFTLQEGTTHRIPFAIGRLDTNAFRAVS